MRLEFRVLKNPKVTHIRKAGWWNSLCGLNVNPPRSKPAPEGEPTSFINELFRQENGEQLSIWKFPLCKRCEHSAIIKGWDK